MTNLIEQLRAYGSYLDELQEVSPTPIARVATRRPRRRAAYAVLAAVSVSVVAAMLVHESGEPSRLTTNVPSSIQSASTTSIAAVTPATYRPLDPAVIDANPTLDQQIARLERWYANAPADAPGGRPMLAAEFVFCTAAPVDPRFPLQGAFASFFPLAQPLTETRIADACARSYSSVPAQQPSGAFKLCTTTQRGPVYDPGAAPVAAITRPLLAFGALSCAAAGYPDAPAGLLDDINGLRNIEINLRAVPSDCATKQEATAWVQRVTTTAFGQSWTIGPLANSRVPSTTDCYRPFLVDRETRQVNFIATPS